MEIRYKENAMDGQSDKEVNRLLQGSTVALYLCPEVVQQSHSCQMTTDRHARAIPLALRYPINVVHVYVTNLNNNVHK